MSWTGVAVSPNAAAVAAARRRAFAAGAWPAPVRELQPDRGEQVAAAVAQRVLCRDGRVRLAGLLAAQATLNGGIPSSQQGSRALYPFQADEQADARAPTR